VNPIINLFSDTVNKGAPAIDATNNLGVGVGDAIRLKWDTANYLAVANGAMYFYMNNGGSPIGTMTPTSFTYAGKDLLNPTVTVIPVFGA
jgi:hypothetical protein